MKHTVPAERQLPKDETSLTPRGLQRRLKRHLLSAQGRYLAICTLGLERFLQHELQTIPEVHIPAVVAGGVEFSGPLDLVYATNLRLRTATRVLLRIDSFTARSYPELFNKCRRISWELYVGFATAVSVEVSAKHSRLHHSENIAAAVFDGLTERMARLGRTVACGEDAPLRFFVRLFDDTCTISVDSSGELLYKRGYHAATAKAPIRETIAAALLQAAHWERYPLIADPLCGSGTLIIEAARMAAGILPGSDRDFAFMHWPAFDEARWLRLKRQAQAEAAKPPTVRLHGSDLNDGALAAAAANATRAGVASLVSFTKADCRRFNADRGLRPPGLIISNPPWGRRIGDQQSVLALWRDLGRQLKETCQGWHFGLVVPDHALLRAAGLTARQRVAFPSGGINVELCLGTI